MRGVVLSAALLAAVALGVSIWRFNAAMDAGSPMSDQTRADFVRSAIEGCVARQKASPDNAGVAPDTIASFCGCYADSLATRVSTRDIDAMTGASAIEMQSAMRTKMADSEGVCFERLDGGR